MFTVIYLFQVKHFFKYRVVANPLQDQGSIRGSEVQRSKVQRLDNSAKELYAMSKEEDRLPETSSQPLNP
jgi:hypothetical protein